MGKIYSVFHMAARTTSSSRCLEPVRPCHHRRPVPDLRRLRDTAPVTTSSATTVWASAANDDVVRLLRDTATFSSSAMDDFMTGGMLRRQRARTRGPMAQRRS